MGLAVTYLVLGLRNVTQLVRLPFDLAQAQFSVDYL